MTKIWSSTRLGHQGNAIRHFLIKLSLKQKKLQNINETKKNEYYFMGDDTNDIEIASHSNLACIVMPCSDAMQNYINIEYDLEKDKKEDESDMLDWLSTQRDDMQNKHFQQSHSKSIVADVTNDGILHSSSLKPKRITRKLYTAPVNGYRGTESNLELILSKLRQDVQK